MGDGLLRAEVFAAANSLNSMFNARNAASTRQAVVALRTYLYPNLLRGTTRQGSLWFAASVLTPHFDFTDHPGNSHRRWVKWLYWFQQQRHDSTAQRKIIEVIGYFLDSTDANAAIEWIWHESPTTFSVQALGADGNAAVANNAPWQVTVTSISANPGEIDELSDP